MKTFEKEKDKPSYVCFECGEKYLTKKQKTKDIIVTAFFSNCGLCEKEKTVTNIRNFNYLNKLNTEK